MLRNVPVRLMPQLPSPTHNHVHFAIPSIFSHLYTGTNLSIRHPRCNPSTTTTTMPPSNPPSSATCSQMEASSTSSSMTLQQERAAEPSACGMWQSTRSRSVKSTTIVLALLRLSRFSSLTMRLGLSNTLTPSCPLVQRVRTWSSSSVMKKSDRKEGQAYQALGTKVSRTFYWKYYNGGSLQDFHSSYTQSRMGASQTSPSPVSLTRFSQHCNTRSTLYISTQISRWLTSSSTSTRLR